MIKVIEKTTEGHNQAPLNYHIVASVRSMRGAATQPFYVAIVQSYQTLDRLVSGDDPQQVEPYQIDSLKGEAFDDSIYDLVTNAMITDDQSRWFDGIIVPVNVGAETLALAIDRKREELRSAREKYLRSNLVTPFGEFDCGYFDQKKITDAILLAQWRAAKGEVASFDWTLADNTVVTLTGEQMIDVGLMYGQRVEDAHARYRVLRDLVGQAASVEEVDAITWERAFEGA